MYNYSTNTWELSDLMVKLQSEKKAGFELQERKHDDWKENYELYRNKVKTNRLTQRQAVNIPLMKETIKTILSSIDEPPNVDWQDMGGDKQKELVYQEIWNEQFKDNKLELIDILDKKNVLLYGISIKKLNLTDKGVNISVLDPYDVLIDPLMQNWDTETAKYIVHQNIFRKLRDILADPKYSSAGKEELKIWIDTPEGIVQGEKDKQAWEEKMERLQSMGVNHADFPYFASGDMIVSLTEHFSKIWNGKEFEKRVIVYANDSIELYNEKLKDAIGVDFWPFTIWTEDPEVLDVYPDCVADLIRTPNKVLNVWFSQLIENRTLKNFQMHWFMPNQNYSPQTYTPGPGMMLPAPPGDDISKVIKPVEISGLDDTLESINILTNIVERGSGATAIQKGQSEKGSQTLGEIEIITGKAMERSTAMTKFYQMSWQELADKWNEMMHNNGPGLLKLYKQGRSGTIYEKRVTKNEWKSTIGYKATIRSSSEQEQEQMQTIQKFQFILGQFPNNPELRKVAQTKMLDLVDLTPEEMSDIEEAEKQTVEPEVSPEDQQLTKQIQQQVGQLQ